jgi:uncharacterized membrane protein
MTTVAGGGLLYRALTGNCYAYRALGIDSAKEYSPAAGVRAQQGVHFEKTMVVNRPAAVIYSFWRQLNNLPQIMDHLESVVEEGNVSHWTARGPLGTSITWDAEIFDERPNELLAWRSIPGGQMDTAGSLRLEALSHNRGTAVRLNLKYDPPGGSAGSTLASWFGRDVEGELVEGLRGMKQLLEAGETPVTDRAVAGQCSRVSMIRRRS